MSNKTKAVVLFSSLAIVLFMAVGLSGVHASSNDGGYRQLQVYSEVLSRVRSEYVEEPNIPLVTDGMTAAQWTKEQQKWRKVSEQILGSLSDGAPTNFRHELLGAKYRAEKYSMQRVRYTLTDG